MLRPLHIALIELKRYLVNRGELGFSLALPIVLFALMYGAFGGEESFHATAHVVDLDGGTHARVLIERLDAMEEITVRGRTLDEANDALERSVILTAVVIPSGFSDGFESGDPIAITFRKRGNGGDSGQIVEAIVRSVAQQMGAEARVRHAVHGALSDSDVSQDRIEAVVDQRLAESRQNPTVRVETRWTGAEASDPTDRMVPGLLVLFLMFAVTLGANALVEERQNGTMERLMTTRLGINQLFVGKFLASTLRAIVQALILLSLAFAVFRIGDVFDFVELMLFSVLIAMAVSAIGLVIGSVARTRDQAAWVAVFFTMFMTIFGGTFFDVAGSGPLDTLSRFTLTHYAIDAMFGILAGGETIGQQGLGIAVLAGIAAVGLLIARTMFRVAGGGR